jgi:YD repeat-containing protein
MIHPITRISVLLVLSLLIQLTVTAQIGGTTRYVYDNKGQLRAVIIPNGEAAVYEYDPAGNFTAIRRLTATDFELIEFTPREGAIGTPVTIYGVGLKEEVSNVSFNGVSAQITSQTQTSVVATVPVGASTGPISVTTPRGTRTTSNNFTVKGVRVTPEAPTVSSGRTLQFTANVAGLLDPSVVWSVNTFVGGNNAVGTISPDGLYTAPDLLSGPTTQFIVKATSVSEPSLFGEAQVTIPGQGGGNEFLAQAVSVRYGTPQNIASTFAPARAVSVRYGTPPNNPLAYVSGNLVSVRYGSPPNIVTAPFNTRVSVSAGPVVSLITPATISKGATVSITVSGLNLIGASRILLIKEDGTVESTITVSNIVVNSGGTSLTASVAVDASTTTGRRVVSILANTGRTPLNEAGANTIEIIP